MNAYRYEKAKVDLGNALTVLEAHLLHRTVLVGHGVTIADITIVSALLYPMKLVCDKNYLKNFNNVVRWFTTCVNQPEFAAVVGTVVLCKKELLAEGQAPAAGPAKAPKEKAAKKEKAPKDDEEEEPPLVPVEKKAEHPYKIMDKDSPSPFSMDGWKKTYSNSTSYDEAMKVFWETFDSNGWTLWFQAYNYNEDNKRIFMTANAIGGFQQRTDEIRKWAFGVQDVRLYSMTLFVRCTLSMRSENDGPSSIVLLAKCLYLFMFVSITWFHLIHICIAHFISSLGLRRFWVRKRLFWRSPVFGCCGVILWIT